MKLIIAGGRDYSLSADDLCWLDMLPNITEVVSGGARGADRGGEQWARGHQLSVRVFNARWEELGKGAGPARNQEMADYADALAIFPGGRGTANMRARAEKAGLVIYERPSAVRPFPGDCRYIRLLCSILGAEVVRVTPPALPRPPRLPSSSSCSLPAHSE